MTAGLSWVAFDALFQRFVDSPTSTRVHRWEARDSYSIPADEPSLVAFRQGTPRPERSVRTSAWLARIAMSTVAGKEWVRVRRIAEGDDYFAWELLAYVESQAAGERVLMVDLDDEADLPPDVWVFDGTTPADRYAIVMHYADDGTVDRLEHLDDLKVLPGILDFVQAKEGTAVELNVYLAHRREVSGAA